ncbi:hypothetical protein [Lacticaseibacillus saniviri]
MVLVEQLASLLLTLMMVTWVVSMGHYYQQHVVLAQHRVLAAQALLVAMRQSQTHREQMTVVLANQRFEVHLGAKLEVQHQHEHYIFEPKTGRFHLN